MTAPIRCGVVLATLLQAAVALGADRRAADPPAGAEAQRAAVPHRVIVKLRDTAAFPGATTTGVAALDRALAPHLPVGVDPVLPMRRAARKPSRTGLDRVVVVRYAAPTPPELVAAALAGLDAVEYAEPQWMQRIAAIPNDPNWVSQNAYMSRMRFPQAWDRTKGEQGSVVVAVVDGGTEWRHGDLAANVWSNPGEIEFNSLDDDGNGYVDDVRGWNFANDSNDPTGLDATPFNAEHGTHVAGIVCAVTNNAQHIAGGSWNAQLMPVCVSSQTDDGGIAFGYEGILYAADNGADVINCSWGSTASPSAFEQEVVEYAWEQGAAVVAAAGNGNPTPSAQPHHPSAYPHALAVGNVDNSDVRVGSSNFGTWVDVSAQGLNIMSTIPGEVVGLLTGTSMSCPFASAACALVKTRWPGYTPDQVMERVRVTSDNIDAINPSRAGLIGYGRINVEAALTKNTPAVRLTDVQIQDADGDGVVEAGETVDIHLEVTNFLAACTGVSFRLRESSIHASVVDSVASAGAIDSLQTVVLPPLRIAVGSGAPIGHPIPCTLAITTTSPSYSDKDRFTITALPPFTTHDINRVHTSVTSLGKLGSTVAGAPPGGGVGFRYDGGVNLLFEGALLIGTAANRISDAARTTSTATDDDFATTPDGVPHLLQPGPLAPQQSRAAFTDALATSPLPVTVRQETYAYADSVHDDYVIVRYAIQNTGASPLTGLRVGWYCDWDIDGLSFRTNRTGFDATRHLGWVQDTGDGPTTWVGLQVLNAPGATAYRGIWNDHTMAPDWGTYDGFTDTEKWECLSGGIVHPVAGPADVSHTIATGPFNVAPGDTVEVGFAFLGGVNQAALQAHADAAALKWQHLHSGSAVEIHDLSAAVTGGSVALGWRTTHETDVAAFRIFRSTDDAPLERLQPDVAPNAEHSYTFTDATPFAGSNLYRVAEVGGDGAVRLAAAVRIEVGAAPTPRRTYLAGPVPNPFNPTTTLRFGVAVAGPVALDVFDARGRRVRSLWSQAHTAAGEYSVRWDGRDDGGRRVASGSYVARLRAIGTTLTRRLTLLQ